MLVLFYILIFGYAHADFKPICSWQDLKDSCPTVKSYINDLVSKNDPSVKVKTFTDKKKKLEQLFERVKGALSSEILAGRAVEELSTSEKSFYLKIKSIRLIPPEKASGYSCEGRSQLNGKYFSDLHAFVICPGFEFLPDSAYMSSMLHELTHSIDPCMAQFPLVKLNFNQIEPARRSGKFNEFIEDEIDDWKSDLDEYSHRVKEQNLRSTERWRNKYSDEDLAHMREFGLLSEAAPGILVQDYPFKRAVQCLGEIGVKLPDKNLPSKDSAGNGTYPFCLGPLLGAQSQVPESMADLVAGRVLGKLMKEEGPRPQKPDMTFWLLQQKACASKPAEERGREYYLSSEDRFNKLLLTSPEMRKAMGCLLPSTQKDCSKFLSREFRQNTTAPNVTSGATQAQ